MTSGGNFAIAAAIMAIAGLVSVGINAVGHSAYGMAVGAGLLLCALVFAILSLRDR